MLEPRKVQISRRKMLLGTLSAGIGVTTALIWWKRRKNHDIPTLPGAIVIGGPFKSGEFSLSQLKVNGLDEKCPVTFKVLFEEKRGYCFVELPFFLKKDKPPLRDITIICTVIGKNGKVLGREGCLAFSSSPPRPTVQNSIGSSSGYPGQDIMFELRKGVAIRDVKRIEIIVSCA